MIQLIISILSMTFIISALISMAYGMKKSGNSLKNMLFELDWCLTGTNAQVAFFMFSITAAIACGITASSFGKYSESWIITLDILFILSRMLLIKFHRLKMHSAASI